ncbi:MAG: hypothetical protein LUD14_08405 [Clostridiales bacterium]|nr:hypothetical protein [Clostridiales bacterium]
MRSIVDHYVRRFQRERHKRRKRSCLLFLMALAVTAGVAWQLHSTGIAMTGETCCGLEEHQHSEDCYEEVLVCEEAESEEHVHSGDCYEKQLICDMEEHVHTDECLISKEGESIIEAAVEKAADAEGAAAEEINEDTADSEASGDGDDLLVFRTDEFSDSDISTVSDEDESEAGADESETTDLVYIKSFSITEDITGTEPFDSDDTAGNDSNGSNDIVRSFDTLSYTLSVEMDAYGHTEDESVSYDTARVSFAFVLPCTGDEAEFDTASMAWMDTTAGYEYKIVEENGCQILYCSRLMESADGNPAVPGTRTVNVSIYIKGMKNGQTIQPEFYAWMDGNQVYGESTRDDTAVYDNVVLNKNTTVCDQHADEENGGKEMLYAAGEKITVSAILKMNVYLTPITTPVLTTYDFNVGDSSAINYGLGEVYGSAFTVGISVQLYNDSAEKGLKGLEYPEDDITFELDIEALYNGLSLTGDDYDFTPLLYSYDGNAGGLTNRDGRTVTDYMNSLPYNKRGSIYYSCCDGGTWNADQNGATISVTISDYCIDGTFPITYPSSGNETRQTIASNIGTISAGRFSFIIPYYNVQKGGTNGDNQDYIGTILDSSGDFAITLSDDSLMAVSVSGGSLSEANDNSNQMAQDDDSRSQTARVDPAGSYSNVIMYAEKWGYNQTVPLTTGCSSTGYDWAYPGQEIGILAGVWSTSYYGNKTNYIVGYDDFIKIDADAVELLDEYTGSSDDDYPGMLFYSNAGYSSRSEDPAEGSDGQADYYLTHYSSETIQEVSHVSLLYAVLDTGENWANEDEMRSAVQEDSNISFYDSISAAQGAGKIVGILVQVRGEISAEYPRISINAKIRDDAETDETYMITDTLRIWNNRSLTTINESLPEGEAEITSIPVRTAEDGGYDTAAYCASGVLAASYTPSYTRLTYNDDGSTSGGTPSGMASGDTVLIVGYTTGIEINVLNGGNSETYSLDDGQSYVDFSVKPSITLSEEENRTTTGVTATTKVTAEVTLPAGLTYINGSSYWGGEYTAPGVRGQQGTVSEGIALTEGSSVEYEYTYTDGFGETKTATITIYLEVTLNDDGTTTLVWEFFDVPMMDSSYSEEGLTELLYFSAFIESGSGNQWTLSTEAVISGSGDQRVQTASNGNLADAEIIVTQASGSGIHETVSPLYNEVDSELTWDITHANNASTTEATLLLSVLPASGHTGTYDFSAWSIDASKLTGSTLELYYTTGDMAGKNAASYTADEITAEGSGWIRVEIDISGDGIVSLTDEQISSMKDLTAWVLVGTLGAGDTIEAEESIQTSGNQGGDSYQNVASYRTSNGTALASYATAYIRSRTLEGLTWHDVNGNGVLDSGENVTETVTVTLMKQNDTTGEYEDVINITTGKQIDVMRALATGNPYDYTDSYNDGEYLFYNMPEGTYAVKFTSATGGLDLADYLASPVDEGTDDMIDSDGVPTYVDNILSQTMISGIVMPEITAMSNNIFESADNDSGFFQYELQITKVDTGTQSVLLEGADFKLEKLNSNGDADSSFGTAGSMTGTTDADGIVIFGDADNYEGLTAGTYRLTETKAADGYNLLENPITITIGSDGTISADSYTTDASGAPLLKVIVTNDAGIELPVTGGSGTLPYAMTGVLLTGSAACLLYKTKKRRKEDV